MFCTPQHFVSTDRSLCDSDRTVEGPDQCAFDEANPIHLLSSFGGVSGLRWDMIGGLFNDYFNFIPMFSFFKRKKKSEEIASQGANQEVISTNQSSTERHDSPPASVSPTSNSSSTLHETSLTAPAIQANVDLIQHIPQSANTDNGLHLELHDSLTASTSSFDSTELDQTVTHSRPDGDTSPPNVATENLSERDSDRHHHQNGWFSSLKKGLSKTGSGIAFAFKRVTIDESLMDELEESLLMSDSGIEAACVVVENLRYMIKQKKPDTTEQIRELLAQCIADQLKPLEKPLVLDQHTPTIMMMVGVNGVGKTTTIGKLAKHMLSADYSVLLAAGDTFRAAAREQLMAWGDRNQIHVVSQTGADPSAVIFDAIQSAKSKQIDVVMADTAGRLPTQAHLMDELKKIKRVIQKAEDSAPHEVLLVIDANNGQNALNQVMAFHETLGLTGLIVTKLDGTAKGGIVLAIASQCPIPIYYVGVGERIEDLMPFNALHYGRAMVGLESL